jgi:hypothetical protein
MTAIDESFDGTLIDEQVKLIQLESIHPTASDPGGVRLALIGYDDTSVGNFRLTLEEAVSLGHGVLRCSADVLGAAQERSFLSLAPSKGSA